MSTRDKIRKILDDYSKDRLTESEQKKIEHLIVKHGGGSGWKWRDKAHKLQLEERIVNGIEQQISNSKSKTIHWPFYIGSAAAILLIFFASLWMYKAKSTDQNMVILAKAKDIPSDQIFIQESNGVSFELANEIMTLDMRKRLQYNIQLSKENTVTSIQIPQQKQLNLILADGTKVWLNAGSRIEFSSKFEGEPTRVVKLEGEAFFDVTSNSQRPFVVETYNSNVRVTGTQFNVQSYENEGLVETALVEGLVVFNSSTRTYKLLPGRKIRAQINNNEIQESEFDIASETSWKEGYFTFDQTDLQDVMTQVSKWYNITVKANKYINKVKIGGTFPKDLPLSELLKDLSMLSGVEFKTEGKEVILIR